MIHKNDIKSSLLDDIAYEIYVTHNKLKNNGYYTQIGFLLYELTDNYYKEAKIIIRKKKLEKISNV